MRRDYKCIHQKLVTNVRVFIWAKRPALATAQTNNLIISNDGPRVIRFIQLNVLLIVLERIVKYLLSIEFCAIRSITRAYGIRIVQPYKWTWQRVADANLPFAWRHYGWRFFKLRRKSTRTEYRASWKTGPRVKIIFLMGRMNSENAI